MSPNDRGRLQGRVAIVTGSNSGIGRAIAVAFGAEGAKVICANRQAESKNEDEKEFTTNDLIVKEGGEAVFMELEFSKTGSIDTLVKNVVEKYGRIDVWVNNAGAGGAVGEIWKLTDEEFDKLIDINLKGFFKCVRAASAQMITQSPLPTGNRGSIINICSVFGPRGMPKFAAYSASKAGVTGMSRAAAVDLSPYKVTINCINPGTVQTNTTSGLPEEMEVRLTQKALIGFGQPKDVAGPAVLLASDEGRWIQGTEVFVDGGFSVA